MIDCNLDTQWSCADGKTCIALYDVCDGVEQCPDSSDEDKQMCMKADSRGAPRWNGGLNRVRPDPVYPKGASRPQEFLSQFCLFLDNRVSEGKSLDALTKG